MKNFVLVIFAALLITACGHQEDKVKSADTPVSKRSVSITAAGATFPMPFYNLAFKKYTQSTGTLLTYGGIGSGGGIRSLNDRIVDFGATDAFLSDKKVSAMPAPIVHVPTCIGAVVVAYNLPGVEELKLSEILLQNIFMGEITRWDDKRVAAANPGVKLPELNITVVHRSDGSGTTFIFSDFMSKISPVWEGQVGRGKSLKWPVGIGAKGNPGVAGTIKATRGAIGYIGSEYAFAQNIPFAQLKNRAGHFIAPSIESISAAAQGAMPADTRVMITNSDAPNAYPISGFTWVILYQDQAYDGRTLQQATETLNFLSWLIDKEAQAVAQQVHYAPLPEKAVTQAREILKSVTWNGSPVLK